MESGFQSDRIKACPEASIDKWRILTKTSNHRVVSQLRSRRGGVLRRSLSPREQVPTIRDCLWTRRLEQDCCGHMMSGGCKKTSHPTFSTCDVLQGLSCNFLPSPSSSSSARLPRQGYIGSESRISLLCASLLCPRPYQYPTLTSVIFRCRWNALHPLIASLSAFNSAPSLTLLHVSASRPHEIFLIPV